MTQDALRTVLLSRMLCVVLIALALLSAHGAHARGSMRFTRSAQEPGLVPRQVGAIDQPAQIATPPWATVWAWCAYVAALLLVGWVCWLAHRRRIAYEEQYSRRLEREVVNRTRELALRNGELELANRKLEEASLSDPLTGLGNRRSLMEAMSVLTAAADCVPVDSAPLILMLIDIDRFKLVNDEHGHEAGDRLLERVSSILLECVRRTDRVVRWGGDEFVIACRSMTLDQAAALAERIRSMVSRCKVQISRAHVAGTSCSIGFACYPFIREAPHALSWEQVLKLADMALYSAKATRNSWAGWCGTSRAAGEPDLINIVADDPAGSARNGLIDMRFRGSGVDSLELLLESTHPHIYG